MEEPSGKELDQFYIEAQKYNSDPVVVFVYQKIDKCVYDVKAIYELGICFRDGKIEGYPKNSQQSIKAAQLCFIHLTERCSNPAKKYYYARTVHNLGMTYYKQKKYKEAVNCFFYAGNMGLMQSIKNLKSMENEGLLSKCNALTKSQRQLRSQFMKAACDGDLDTLKKCFELGADIKWRDEIDYDESSNTLSGAMVLHYAAAKGQLGIVKFLATVDKIDTLVNEYDDSFYTPLHCAVDEQNFEIVCVLITLGADVKKGGVCNGQDPSKHINMTPFHMAASLGNVPILEVLMGQLKNKTEINELYDNSGLLPLHCAVGAFSQNFHATETFETLQLIIEFSGIANLRDKDKTTALSLALQKGFIKSAELLLDIGSPVTTIFISSTTVLSPLPTMEAAQQGQCAVEFMALLYKRGLHELCALDFIGFAVFCDFVSKSKDLVELRLTDEFLIKASNSNLDCIKFKKLCQAIAKNNAIIVVSGLKKIELNIKEVLRAHGLLCLPGSQTKTDKIPNLCFLAAKVVGDNTKIQLSKLPDELKKDVMSYRTSRL